MNENTEKLDFLLKFCSVRDTARRIKRQAEDLEKIFAKHIPDKNFVSRIYKALSKLNNEKTKNPLQNNVLKN